MIVDRFKRGWPHPSKIRGSGSMFGSWGPLWTAAALSHTPTERPSGAGALPDFTHTAYAFSRWMKSPRKDTEESSQDRECGLERSCCKEMQFPLPSRMADMMNWSWRERNRRSKKRGGRAENALEEWSPMLASITGIWKKGGDLCRPTSKVNWGCQHLISENFGNEGRAFELLDVLHEIQPHCSRWVDKQREGGHNQQIKFCIPCGRRTRLLFLNIRISISLSDVDTKKIDISECSWYWKVGRLWGSGTLKVI